MQDQGLILRLTIIITGARGGGLIFFWKTQKDLPLADTAELAKSQNVINKLFAMGKILKKERKNSVPL